MAKTHYASYCEHCLRFYARYQEPVFTSEANRKDWEAVDKAIKPYSPIDRELILTVYRERDTVSDNIYSISKRLGIKQNYIWNMIQDVEKNIAIERGLV